MQAIYIARAAPEDCTSVDEQKPFSVRDLLQGPVPHEGIVFHDSIHEGLEASKVPQVVIKLRLAQQIGQDELAKQSTNITCNSSKNSLNLVPSSQEPMKQQSEPVFTWLAVSASEVELQLPHALKCSVLCSQGARKLFNLRRTSALDEKLVRRSRDR